MSSIFIALQIEKIEVATKALADVRHALKNSKLLNVEEMWSHAEGDRKAIINALKDEKVMQVLRINPTHDEFLLQVLSPAKYRPIIPILAQQRVIIKAAKPSMQLSP